jgi:hypothetical protein
MKPASNESSILSGQQVWDEAAEIYKEETGYTPHEHFHRSSTILTTREERNAARVRMNEICKQVESR